MSALAVGAVGRVLIVDDETSMCEMLDARLSRRGFATSWRTDGQEAFSALGDGEFDVVLTDLNMRGLSGLDLCERIVSNRPDVPVIVFTAFGSMESAVAAIRAGAYDFVTKPVDIEALVAALGRAVQHRALREEVKRLRRAVAESGRFEEIRGGSPAMESLYDLLERVADSEASVLVTGESGTGKELVARGLHARSRRSAGPFIAVSCAAVPEQLLESELFGHVRGAFTDARSQRAGLFAQAHGGTLFLDEIGDLPLGLQPKLLRVLQERSLRPVGGDVEVPTDVRIVAATNRDLEGAVGDGTFREDLYFRVNVIPVEVPPLRARGNDVLMLAQHFLERFADRAGKRVRALSGSSAERLLAYSWPGNVRELQNCMERAVALTRYEEVTVEDLPDKVRTYRSSRVVVATDDPTEIVPLAEVERRYILRVLESVGGNKRSAARLLGLDRKTLYRKLDQYGAAPSSGGERS